MFLSNLPSFCSSGSQPLFFYFLPLSQTISQNHFNSPVSFLHFFFLPTTGPSPSTRISHYTRINSSDIRHSFSPKKPFSLTARASLFNALLFQEMKNPLKHTQPIIPLFPIIVTIIHSCCSLVNSREYIQDHDYCRCTLLLSFSCCNNNPSSLVSKNIFQGNDHPRRVPK